MTAVLVNDSPEATDFKIDMTRLTRDEHEDDGAISRKFKSLAHSCSLPCKSCHARDTFGLLSDSSCQQAGEVTEEHIIEATCASSMSDQTVNFTLKVKTRKQLCDSLAGV
eukprot:759977-Hanusia_phi.AAC.11